MTIRVSGGRFMKKSVPGRCSRIHYAGNEPSNSTHGTSALLEYRQGGWPNAA